MEHFWGLRPNTTELQLSSALAVPHLAEALKAREGCAQSTALGAVCLGLDCWVGPLDFNFFVEIKLGFPLTPQKVELFAGGSTATKGRGDLSDGHAYWPFLGGPHLLKNCFVIINFFLVCFKPNSSLLDIVFFPGLNQMEEDVWSASVGLCFSGHVIPLAGFGSGGEQLSNEWSCSYSS